MHVYAPGVKGYIAIDWQMADTDAARAMPATYPEAKMLRLEAIQETVHVFTGQFRVVREANLALLKSLAPEQWKHHGMHAERGEESIEHIVRMIAGHDINHTRQVERIVRAKKK